MSFAELTRNQKRLVQMADLIMLITLPYSNIPQPHDDAPVARNSMHTIRANLFDYPYNYNNIQRNSTLTNLSLDVLGTEVAR